MRRMCSLIGALRLLVAVAVAVPLAVLSSSSLGGSSSRCLGSGIVALFGVLLLGVLLLGLLVGLLSLLDFDVILLPLF